MKPHDLAGGFVWVAVGLCMCIASASLSLGSIRAPGIGFVPFIVGAVLALLGAILARASIGQGAAAGGPHSVALSWRSLLVPSLVLSVLIGYVMLVERLGFLLSSFLCLLALFKISHRSEWAMPLGLAAIVTAATYAVLVLWLRNPLPRGVLGI